MKIRLLGQGRWRLTAFLIGCSGPLVAVLYCLSWPLWVLGAIHGLSALIGWRLWRRPRAGGRELGLQVFSLLLCFPIVGSPMAWLIYGLVGQRQSDLFDSYKNYIAYNYKEPRYLKAVDSRKERLKRELSVLPLHDQLHLPYISAKQSAASALAKTAGDTGVRVLRQALSDPSDDTRLLASLALLRKEEGLVANLNAARKLSQKSSDSPENWLAVARAAKEYNESGLPAPKAAEAYWQECGDAAETALGLHAAGASQLEAWLHLAAARMGQALPAQARSAAEAALACDPNSLQATLAHCEALFALGDLDAMAGASAEFARAAMGSELQVIHAYWKLPHAS